MICRGTKGGVKAPRPRSGARSAALTPPRPRLFSAIGGMSFGCSSGLFGAPIRPLCEEFLRPD
jgi:hypothetical protein